MSDEFSSIKSIHAIRRTVNSRLKCSGVSTTVASSLLGHTERVNEQNYTYDILGIIDCDDDKKRNYLWLQTCDTYSKKYLILEKNYEAYDYFYVVASDYGIKETHYHAASYYLKKQKYNEFEKKLDLAVAEDDIPFYIAIEIVKMVNDYLSAGKKLTDLLESIINKLISCGYNITKENDGYYKLIKNND